MCHLACSNVESVSRDSEDELRASGVLLRLPTAAPLRTDAELVLESGIGNPSSLHIDAAGGMMYWSDIRCFCVYPISHRRW